jgi:hypothetical protein
MESNKRALMILQMLFLTAVVIFFLEKKFLVYETRGATLSHYEDVSGTEKVLLLIDDFEGLSTPGSTVKTDSLLKTSGFFDYGSAKISLDHERVDKNPLASETALMVRWQPGEMYGGWGKGVGANIELNALTDYLNFRVLVPSTNGIDEQFKIMLQEDDDENGVLDETKDDKWITRVTVPVKDQWQTVSIPLKDFTHEGDGGDHNFNVTRKGGLHNIIFVFEQPDKYTKDHKWYFDFICFSNDKMTENLNLK